MQTSYLPSSLVLCDPPDPSQPFHSPLLHYPAGTDFQSNVRSSGVQEKPPQKAFNGLGLRFMDMTSPSVCEDLREHDMPPLLLPPSPTAINDSAINEWYASGGVATRYGSSGSFSLDEEDVSILLSENSITGQDWAASGVLSDFPIIHSDTAPDTLATSQNTKISPSLEELPENPVSYTPPMLPPFPDINMFERAFLEKELPTGVNPADISIAQLEFGSFSLNNQDSPLSLPRSPLLGACTEAAADLSNEISAEILSEIVSIISSASERSLAAGVTNLDTPGTSAPVYNLLYPGQPLPRLSIVQEASSSPFPSPCRKSSRRRVLQDVTMARCNEASPEQPASPDMGTPVLNAHQGISLSELLAKVERYKLRNPGQEIDKRWLNLFAGKLSERGERLEDFRCYVVGCVQTNKRRDHILIHVGSHVDERPFVCAHCPMRFLRNNERKRHETGHTGDRPFACHMCQDPDKAFARLDLLKRHLKRSHGVDTTADKENRSSSGAYKRARHDI